MSSSPPFEPVSIREPRPAVTVPDDPEDPLVRLATPFAITTPINGQPATYANGGTIGFAMSSPEQPDAFHAAGVANGGTTCEDPPGYREGPGGKLYLAYLRDPDGNKICALYRPAK